MRSAGFCYRFGAGGIGRALAMSSRISSGAPRVGSRTSERASCAHLETHMPQPIHAEVSTATTPSPIESAPNWQKSVQLPQPTHLSAATRLT